MAQNDDADRLEADRRKRVRRTTILCALVALAFYVGFIVMMVIRGSK